MNTEGELPPTFAHMPHIPPFSLLIYPSTQMALLLRTWYLCYMFILKTATRTRKTRQKTNLLILLVCMRLISVTLLNQKTECHILLLLHLITLYLTGLHADLFSSALYWHIKRHLLRDTHASNTIPTEFIALAPVYRDGFTALRMCIFALRWSNLPSGSHYSSIWSYPYHTSALRPYPSPLMTSGLIQ